ncbi:MAG: hypothetical protein PHF95_05130 [bacterium]|nr:hypothetical protein [bacterium]
MKGFQDSYKPQLLSESMWKAAYRANKNKDSKAVYELPDHLKEWQEEWMVAEQSITK